MRTKLVKGDIYIKKNKRNLHRFKLTVYQVFYFNLKNKFITSFEIKTFSTFLKYKHFENLY